MEKVAAYIRVSTKKQRDEGSHENQRERIEDWADRHDVGTLDFYEDIAISGQSDNREDYDALMASYEDYDAVVVRELSRFGRDPLTVLQDVEEIVESDTEFISITEQFDSSSAMGKAFLRIVAVINGMYADLRSEQAEEMIERRRERGEPVGRPKKLDESELQDVFDWREGGLSYSTIAALVGEVHGIDVDRSTIYRYCQEEAES